MSDGFWRTSTPSEPSFSGPPLPKKQRATTGVRQRSAAPVQPEAGSFEAEEESSSEDEDEDGPKIVDEEVGWPGLLRACLLALCSAHPQPEGSPLSRCLQTSSLFDAAPHVTLVPLSCRPSPAVPLHFTPSPPPWCRTSRSPRRPSRRRASPRRRRWRVGASMLGHLEGRCYLLSALPLSCWVRLTGRSTIDANTLLPPPPPPPAACSRPQEAAQAEEGEGGWAGGRGGQVQETLAAKLRGGRPACRCRCRTRAAAVVVPRARLPANAPSSPPAPLRPRQDPNAPKRATSAFFYFSQDHRGVGGWVGTLGRRALSGTAVGRAALARYRLAFPSAPWSLCLAAHPQGLTRLLLCGRRHICVAPELPLPPRIASVGA